MESATGNAVFTPKKQPRSKNRGLNLSKESQKSSQFRQLGVLGVLLEALDQQDSEYAVHLFSFRRSFLRSVVDFSERRQY